MSASSGLNVSERAVAAVAHKPMLLLVSLVEVAVGLLVGLVSLLTLYHLRWTL